MSAADVSRQFPHWTPTQVQRHLQQREELVRIAEQQRKQRLVECLQQVYEVRQ